MIFLFATGWFVRPCEGLVSFSSYELNASDSIYMPVIQFLQPFMFYLLGRFTQICQVYDVCVKFLQHRKVRSRKLKSPITNNLVSVVCNNYTQKLTASITLYIQTPRGSVFLQSSHTFSVSVFGCLG